MIHNKDTKHIEEIRAYDKQIIDCKVLESKGIDSINSTIYFMGVELTGGIESNLPYNECLFGELDSKGEFIESKPIYHLINETDYDTLDSKESFTQTLQVFLGSNTLTLLNYSLLDSSLNIKLECNSSESQAIQEKEQAQRDCHDFLQKSRNDDIDRNKDSSNDDMISTAMLHPVLEYNEIKCPHGGIVKLKSNKGKSFKSKGIPMILESDLLNSQIIGCTNNILGVPTPCTLISSILPTARALKKYNGDYPIMQDLVNGNIFTDKGFPLIATPKPNTCKYSKSKLKSFAIINPLLIPDRQRT